MYSAHKKIIGVTLASTHYVGPTCTVVQCIVCVLGDVLTPGSGEAQGASSPVPSRLCLSFGEQTSMHRGVALADEEEELCGLTGPENADTFWNPALFPEASRLS